MNKNREKEKERDRERERISEKSVIIKEFFNFISFAQHIMTEYFEYRVSLAELACKNVCGRKMCVGVILRLGG